MIKEMKHVVLGISFSPTGDAQGAMSAAEANKTVTDIAQNFDEVQTHVIRQVLDERGNPSFVLNQYIFVKYAEATAKAK